MKVYLTSSLKTTYSLSYELNTNIISTLAFYFNKTKMSRFSVSAARRPHDNFWTAGTYMLTFDPTSALLVFDPTGDLLVFFWRCFRDPAVFRVIWFDRKFSLELFILAVSRLRNVEPSLVFGYHLIQLIIIYVAQSFLWAERCVDLNPLRLFTMVLRLSVFFL